MLIPYLAHGKNYYTCCQHIAFRKFIPLWKALNINTAYVVHKRLDEHEIDGVV